MSLAAITVDPPGLAEARAALAGIDRLLCDGIGAEGEHSAAVLTQVVSALGDGALAGRVTAAAVAFATGRVAASDLVAVAAARHALRRTTAELLAAQAASALGLTLSADPDPPPEAAPEALDGPLGRVRAGLAQVALGGLVSPPEQARDALDAALDGLHGEPRALRLLALGTRLLDPEVRPDRIAELWSRAVLATVVLPTPGRSRAVSGRLDVLGATVQGEGEVVTVTAWGVLDLGEERRLVHRKLTLWDADGADLWTRLARTAPGLVDALAASRCLELRHADLLPSGEIVWRDRVEIGPRRPPWEVAMPTTLHLPPSSARHPEALAVAVVTSGPELLEALPVDVDTQRAELDWTADWTNVGPVVGLLRWHDGWRCEPLAAAAPGRWLGPSGPIRAARDTLTFS